MLIKEFVESPLNLEDVDLKDDLKFFMHNDPGFYRRVFYPMISKVRDHIKQGHPCRDDIFRGAVDHAAKTYCQKFKIADNHKSVFTDTDRDELAREIFGKERDNIEQGDYDGDDQ
jgi:hypothetical protein